MLPIRRSFNIRRVNYSVADFTSLEEVGQVVSLRGVIVDRLHMSPIFASEKTGQSFAIHKSVTWLGIPGTNLKTARVFGWYFLYLKIISCAGAGNKKMILKVGNSRDHRMGRFVDVYITFNQGQVYPKGLSIGTEIELSWLFVRKTVRSGRIYCTATPMTCICIRKTGTIAHVLQ